jgi:uncharacterized protein YgiM (DUF1202 family)
MDLDSKSSLRVIADYQAPYSDPIRVKEGDEISLDRNKVTELAGWVWGTDHAGKSGWVPEAYIEPHGDTGIMRCDYNAIELTIHVGEILTFHEAESGFYWVTDQSGRQGWVPASHVEPYEIKVE